MERVVAGGDAERHQTRTLSTLYQYTLSMAGGGGMQLRFWWVGVRGRLGWKSDRRQVVNRVLGSETGDGVLYRQVGRLHFHRVRLQVGRFSQIKYLLFKATFCNTLPTALFIYVFIYLRSTSRNDKTKNIN